MIQHLIARLRQGHRTLPYPARQPALPDRYPGRPDFVAVRPGAASLDGRVQVPDGALRPGERVVVHSDGVLQPGARLRIVDRVLAGSTSP